MSDFLTTLRTIATKAETVAGTPETLADADNNVRCWDLSIGSIDVPFDEDPSKYATGDFGLGESIPGNQSAKISWRNKFQAEADGTSAAPGTEPSWTKFVKTAGCTVTSAVSADYSGYKIYPDVTKAESTLTIGIYDKSRGATQDGLFYEFTGGIANCVISTEGTGRPFNMSFEYTTGLNDIDDITVGDIPELTNASTRIPDRFIDGLATIGSFSACISTMSFDFGNQISPVECIGAESGYEKFGIVGSTPKLTINPKLTKNSDYDVFGKLIAGTIEEVTILTDEFRFHAPRCQITSMNIGDADGILREELVFTPLRPTTPDSIAGYAPWSIFIKNWNKV